jgi:PAS domain S-box-containing protein
MPMTALTTRLERLLQAVPDALVGMDQKGVIRFVNHQTESLFGYDRDQLIGQPIETLVPESLWQIYTEHLQDYFADPRTRSSGLELELSGRHQDGTEFSINISLSTIDTGDVLLAITAVRDVTQQEQAVKNAALIAAIVEYSDDAIIGGSLDGTITSWNLAAEGMYGYSSKEIVGKSGRLLTPDDRADEFKTILAKVKAGEHVEGFETERVRKDGTVFPVSITIAPIRDENDAVVGSSAVHHGLMEQGQALTVAQRLAAIVESSDDAIIGRTLDGIVTSWNPAAERMFGYSSQEIVGKPIDLLSPKDRAGEMVSILAKISAGRPVDNFETVRVRKDATVFPVSLTVSPIRYADGAVVGASVIARDVTERGKGVRGRPAHGCHCRGFGRCHHRRLTRRHHHELEPSRRANVRLLRRGGHRQARQVPDSQGSSRRSRSCPGADQSWPSCRAPRDQTCPKERNGVPGLAHCLPDSRR